MSEDPYVWSRPVNQYSKRRRKDLTAEEREKLRKHFIAINKTIFSFTVIVAGCLTVFSLILPLTIVQLTGFVLAIIFSSVASALAYRNIKNPENFGDFF